MTKNSKLIEVHNSSVGLPGFLSDLNTLPAKANGYTDDLKEQNLEDGSPNPQFSYWTVEGFNEFVGIALYRFANPVFGEWEAYTVSGKKETLNNPVVYVHLKDLFDPKYLEEVKGKPIRQWLPIFADWDNNDYGMKDKLLDGPRWMGEIENVNVKFDYDKNSRNYRAFVSANVTYKAWAKDQSVLEKKGVISFTVNKGDDPDRRYLIRDTKLEIKE